MLRRQGSIRDMCAIKTSLILLFFWVISSQQRNCTPLELSSGFFLSIAKFPVRVFRKYLFLIGQLWWQNSHDINGAHLLIICYQFFFQFFQFFWQIWLRVPITVIFWSDISNWLSNRIFSWFVVLAISKIACKSWFKWIKVGFFAPLRDIIFIEIFNYLQQRVRMRLIPVRNSWQPWLKTLWQYYRQA